MRLKLDVMMFFLSCIRAYRSLVWFVDFGDGVNPRAHTDNGLGGDPYELEV